MKKILSKSYFYNMIQQGGEKLLLNMKYLADRAEKLRQIKYNNNVINNNKL